MNQNLKEILQKKKSQSLAGSAIDWDDRRNKYCQAVERLYQQIESMFSEAIADKSIVLQRRPKQLTEDFIGTYTVDDLLLLIGDEQVRFSPRGRNIAGAEGRVDVVGERGVATLIAHPEFDWAFVQSRQPKLLIVRFDESALAEVLELVMRDR